MSATELSTPAYGRRASASSLDFVYWAMTTIVSSYTRNTTMTPFRGASEDELLIVQLLVYAAEQVGLLLPPSLDAIRERITQEDRFIPVSDAYHTRGAPLFRNRGAGICLGDNKRIVEVAGRQTFVRHLTNEEKNPSYWLDAALVPGLVYL